MRRHHGILRKAAVSGLSVTGPMLTQVGKSRAARLAHAAGLTRVYNDIVAHLDIVYIRTDLHDLAAELMTHDRSGRDDLSGRNAQRL